MSKSKKLSNPFSTGGGGSYFEACVQASFVTLMLTGGYAPCLPCWPIAEIKLQGKIDGFDTDDLIVVVENADDRERRKLLGQVKHSIAITQRNDLFGEVIQAAWNDFNNPEVFAKDKDVICLITGPLSATDANNVQWLLNQARHTKSVDEFFQNAQQANFGPPKRDEKLQVIQHHLKTANGGNEVPSDELYNFLRRFHLLSYDLGNESGIVLSLLHSHISQFQRQDSQWAWSRVVEIVQMCNQGACTITPDKLPEDLLKAFRPKTVTEMPEKFKASQKEPKTDWAQHRDAMYLAYAVLIGAWNEKSKSDIEVITRLLGISYDQWLKKAREILHFPDSPLTLKNGIWKVVNQAELWNLLGSRILDQNLDTFKSLAIAVLKEPDPAFELPAEERYAASIHGKVLEYSPVLREGIAVGLAILGSQPDACSNCSQGKAETTCVLVLRELLTDADWALWGSLNRLLPTLAEAAPGVFLASVEKALRRTPCPFDELFAQEGSGIITGGNHLTGLFRALEGLAWDEQFLVSVCVVLGELASRDPGGQWANRPSNSLATILLPWLPQTLAPVGKRKVAVQTLCKEWPDIGWKLVINLLPNQIQGSSGSYKPSWYKTIPDDVNKSISTQEYWEQVNFYAELAVSMAGDDTEKLAELTDQLGDLPKPAFDQILKVLGSKKITALPEEKTLILWEHITKFISHHRRFPNAEWTLNDDSLSAIEAVSKNLSPSNPLYRYQHLFAGRDFDLYEDNNFKKQRKKLEKRRIASIQEILEVNGISAVIRFVEAVERPEQVGLALGCIEQSIDSHILPKYLVLGRHKLSSFARGFVWSRHRSNGWSWSDALDKSTWNSEQIVCFLTFLPFTNETWHRASLWLGEAQSEYWLKTDVNPYHADKHLNVAIEKLIEYGRPYAAIDCFDRMRQAEQPVDITQGVRALLAALSSTESTNVRGAFPLVKTIKFLQSNPEVPPDDLLRIEWAYFLILNRHGASPKLLENHLSKDPKFFCKIIQFLYRSEKEGEQSQKERSGDSKEFERALRLLNTWQTPPGMQEDGSFNDTIFKNWLQHVKKLCNESGHLESALYNIGKVLTHSPADSNGLWINHAVAEALNDRDEETMRNGYRDGVYNNSRGVHRNDPEGKPKQELAEQSKQKAEDVENAGFYRLAVTLRELADDYEQEVKQIVDTHVPEGSE